MASLGNIYLKFTADTGDLVRGINSIDGQLKGFASSIKGITGLLGGAFAVSSLAAFGKEAIKMSSQIESAFTKIKNLTDTSAEDLDFFKGSLASVSSQVGRSQKELAEGLYGITSSGLVGKEAMEALEIASKASAIGLGDVNTIARSLTGVLNAYGKENISAARAAEILFQTLKLGSLEAEALAPALSKVLPISSALGISFEQVGAFIAQASLAGTEASEAVTQLTSIIGALVTPSSEAEETLKGVGLSMEIVRDMAKKDLSEALIFLNEKLGGNEEAIGKVLGRKEAIVGFYSVVGAKADQYRAKVEGTTAATDDFGKAFNDVGQTSAQKWAVFSAVVDNVKASIGEALIVIINKFLPQTQKGMDSLAASLEDLPKKAERVAEQIGTIITAFKELYGWIEKVREKSGIDNFVGGLQKAAFVLDRIILGVKKVKFADVASGVEQVRKSANYSQEDAPTGPIANSKPYVAPKPTKPTTPPGGADKDQISILDQLNKKRQALVTTLENYIAAGRDTAVLENQIISLDARILEITKTRDAALTGSISMLQQLQTEQTDLQDQLTKAIETHTEYGSIQEKLIAVGSKIAAIEREKASAIEGVSTAIDNTLTKQAKFDVAPIAAGKEHITEIGDKVAALGGAFTAMGQNAAISMNGINQAFLQTSGVLEQFNDSFQSIIQEGISESLAALGEQLASAFSGEGFNLKAVLIPIADMLIDIGKLAISTGIAISGIKAALKSLNPFVAIAAGVALVALGTLVKGKLSRSTPKLAKGALSYGEHTATIGDNPNARFDPEVTAPSSKLKKIFEDITFPLIKELSLNKEKKDIATPDLSFTEPSKKISQINLPDFIKDFIPSILPTANSLQGTAYVTVEGEFKFRNNELIAAVKSGQAVHLRNHGS